MIAAALFLIQADEIVRTPAIYRIPAKEVRLDRLEEMISSDGFDGYCIEPKVTPAIKAVLAQGKVKAIDPKTIDTKANLAWRNATVDFAAGRLSPKAWLAKTAKLGETVHFLTNPKTKTLRESLPGPSYKSVLAEMLLMCWPGRLCLTSTDIWQARWFPEDKAYESWILAMNDHMGPMLYYRFKEPYMVTGKPKIVSAPDKPGLFAFELSNGKRSLTVYLNNSDKPVRLPKVDLDRATHDRGLNVEDGYTELAASGSLIVEGGEAR